MRGRGFRAAFTLHFAHSCRLSHLLPARFHLCPRLLYGKGSQRMKAREAQVAINQRRVSSRREPLAECKFS